MIGLIDSWIMCHRAINQHVKQLKSYSVIHLNPKSSLNVKSKFISQPTGHLCCSIFSTEVYWDKLTVVVTMYAEWENYSGSHYLKNWRHTPHWAEDNFKSVIPYKSIGQIHILGLYLQSTTWLRQWTTCYIATRAGKGAKWSTEK